MTPSSLGHDRYCDELLVQTEELRALLRDTDPGQPVPTCPGWNAAALLRHVGGNLLTVGAAVRAGEPAPGAAPSEAPDAEQLDDWLAAAAKQAARALRDAGPDRVATVFGVTQPTLAWARRATHDVVIHRADAAATVGARYEIAPDVAADAIDELLELAPAIGLTARLADPHGPQGVTGGTLHLHATDTPAEAGAEWLIELRDAGFTWSREHAKADVAVRGPLADVLRTFYRRLPAGSDRVEVLGDAALLDFWLERVSLG